MKVTLQASRANAGLTITQASKLLNVSPSTIVRWEKNPKIVTAENQAKIEKIYGMPIENIVWHTKTEDR